MTDEDFADTLRAVLDNPPLPPAPVDGEEFTTTVARDVRRRRRTRHAAAGSLVVVMVAAGILVPTVLTGADGGGHTARSAVTPADSTTQQASTTPSTTGSSGSVLTEQVIVNMIVNFAVRCKDPAPTSIQYAYGTRNDLSTFISQDTIDGPQGQAPAVLVEATGNFTMSHSAPKGGNPISTGTAIYLVIDQKTGNGTDLGIMSQPIELSPLGHVFHPAVPKQ